MTTNVNFLISKMCYHFDLIHWDSLGKKFAASPQLSRAALNNFRQHRHLVTSFCMQGKLSCSMQGQTLRGNPDAPPQSCGSWKLPWIRADLYCSNPMSFPKFRVRGCQGVEKLIGASWFSRGLFEQLAWPPIIRNPENLIGFGFSTLQNGFPPRFPWKLNM